MKTSKEIQNELTELYKNAVKNNLVSSKTDFAIFCGVSRTALTQATNGEERYCTERMLHTVKCAVEEGLQGSRTLADMKPQPVAIEQPSEVGDSASITHIVEKMIGEMAAQRESYERILLAALQFDKKNA